MTMKLRIGLTLAIAVGIHACAEAQDGGKIPWKGKAKNEDVKALMAQAQKEGKAIMMFFTSEGWGPCKALSAGAFSDDKVVEASKQVMPIFVDCDWGKKNKDISDKYKVRGYPTVIFTDPEGKELEHLGKRDAESVAAQIESVAGKYPAKKK
jgi:thioredoxin-related protein